MTLRRLHCTLALAGAGALLGTSLAACGSSGASPTFTRDFRSQEAALTQLGRDLAGVIQGASQQTDLQLARQLKPLANRNEAVLRRLETLRPPSDLSTDYSALHSALSRRVTDLRAIVQGLKSHNAASAKSATQSLLIDSAAASTALRSIDSKLG